jgi:glutamate racemase
MSDKPIGIFDSGVGGTSIWKEIQKLMPYENTIYLADSANAPYGAKSQEDILALSIKNTELLLDKGCKLIVVACNTATTNAISHLRQHYDVPFIGIEPAIKPAALKSKSRKVGVLATKGTLASSLFHSTSENHAAGIEILEQEGSGLVPLIEEGEIQTDATKKLLQRYLNPMLAEGIDYLVLGCTHYPYLIPVLQEILPENVKIIDSGEAVARQTKTILEKRDLAISTSTNCEHQFFTNSNVELLEQFLNDVDANLNVKYLDF